MIVPCLGQKRVNVAEKCFQLIGLEEDMMNTKENQTEFLTYCPFQMSETSTVPMSARKTADKKLKKKLFLRRK